MNKPECYITERSHSPLPARVVKETKSTVTVESAYPSGVAFTKTFNKRKRYGSEWVDPRTENNSIGERGQGFYGARLRFDVAKVEAEQIEQKRRDQRTAIGQVMACGTSVEGALDRAALAGDTPTGKAWIAFKEALQAAYMEAGGE